MTIKIISGGQTGVDRAALDAATACGLACGGYVPKGRLAEDGPLPAHYPMTETENADYIERTLKNVRLADATLILCRGPLSGGTEMTADFCKQEGKPYRVVDLSAGTSAAAARTIQNFLDQEQPKVLNIAGPRESLNPGIYQAAYDLLLHIFRRL